MISVGGVGSTTAAATVPATTATPVGSQPLSQSPLTLNQLANQVGATTVASLMGNAGLVMQLDPGPAATLDLSGGAPASGDTSALYQAAGMYQLIQQGGSRVVQQLQSLGAVAQTPVATPPSATTSTTQPFTIAAPTGSYPDPTIDPALAAAMQLGNPTAQPGQIVNTTA